MRVISFIGLDGSGKTTQSTLFTEARKLEGRDSVYEHQFRFSSKRAMNVKARLRPWLLRAQGAVCADGTVVLAPNADSAGKRSAFVRFLQRIVLVPPLVVAVAGMGWHRTRSKLRRHRGREMLVTDRHFVDELVRIEWKLGIRLPWRRLWLRFVRTPDLVFYFEIPGEVSWERMDPQDSSADAMRRKEAVYGEWLPLLAERCDVVRLPVTGCSIDEVRSRVEERYAALCADGVAEVCA